MPFWDYIHVNRSDSERPHRNLQEGLFQIASQTCSILVQVNNTNNISYGNNATNVQYNNYHPPPPGEAGPSTSSSSHAFTSSSSQHGARNKYPEPDAEQILSLIPSTRNITASSQGLRAKKFFADYRHRLSTVLEGNTPAGDDDFELWDQNQMLRSENHGHFYKWGHGGWCKPSCIPITVIFTLIVLVVLLPLLEHNNDRDASNLKSSPPYICSDMCQIELVESIPEGLTYPPNAPVFKSTFKAWQWLLDNAVETIDIASFYWTMTSSDVYNHSSSWQGDQIFQQIMTAGTERKLKIRIAQSAPTQDQPNIDTELLVKRKAADVRSVNFPRLLGGGVLHTKLWIIDNQHVYLGSANMDWRALTQFKEMGVLITNCSCLAKDVAKIFSVYWQMGRDSAMIPPVWPFDLATKYNTTHPINVDFNDGAFNFNTYLSSSPPPMSTKGRAQDIDAITNIILHAEKFVHVAVMDYFPLTIYTPKMQYWPVIDDALRTAAVQNHVSVKLLISWWNHSRPAEDYFLRSLEALSGSYRGVDVQVKRFIVPVSPDQEKIPFGRVNHNKYMVTESTAYIGTSNWSGDYFTNTAGIGLVMEDSVHERNTTQSTIRSDLAAVFERDWNSLYAVDLIK